MLIIPCWYITWKNFFHMYIVRWTSLYNKFGFRLFKLVFLLNLNQKSWISRSKSSQRFCWLNNDFVSSQVSLNHVRKFSRQGTPVSVIPPSCFADQNEWEERGAPSPNLPTAPLPQYHQYQRALHFQNREEEFWDDLRWKTWHRADTLCLLKKNAVKCKESSLDAWGSYL